MKQYGISYVKKDNHKTSVEGYSLYTKYYNAHCETCATDKFRFSKLYFENKDWIRTDNPSGNNFRSIWEVKKKGEKR